MNEWITEKDTEQSWEGWQRWKQGIGFLSALNYQIAIKPRSRVTQSQNVTTNCDSKINHAHMIGKYEYKDFQSSTCLTQSTAKPPAMQ